MKEELWLKEQTEVKDILMTMKDKKYTGGGGSHCIIVFISMRHCFAKSSGNVMT